MKESINKILSNMKNIGIKKILILTCLILSFLLIIIVVFKYVENNNFEKKVRNTEYSSYEDFKTTREYIVYSGNEYIKEEKSRIDGIENDIYLKFKEGPLQNGTDNQQDYESLIYIVANTQYFYNFRLIDESRNLIIVVECDQSNKKVIRILYNGEENYFERQKSIESVKNKEEKQEKNVDIQSIILKNIVENNWNANSINISERKEIENNYYIYNDYMVRVISKKIYNIVFLNECKDNIVNNLKVGDSQEKIINELGKPDYDELGIIGYKFENIYVFFGNENISVYRVDNTTEGNDEFIELMNTFRENKNSKQLASKITDIWDDYNDFEVDGNYIYIEYALRGLKIQFNVTNEHGIILYNNYKGDIDKGLSLLEIENVEQLPLYTYIYGEENLVNEAEIKRAVNFGKIAE